MTFTEIPTPITDSNLIKVATSCDMIAVATYKGKTVVDADFARTLERHCAELADRLKGHTCTDKTCSELDCVHDREAIARWNEFKKGVGG